MLEHLPGWLGDALKGVRAGHDKLAAARLVGAAGADNALRLTSSAFAAGGPLPIWTTADGDGTSPPLAWEAGPAGTAGFALIVEDPDAPTSDPLVHGIVWNLGPDDHGLPRGAIAANGGADTGTNSYGRTGWLPPDPPTGHGPHDYVFQLFALSEPLPLDPDPGRGALLEALEGRVLAVGVVVGTHERPTGEPVRAGAPAAT